MANRIAKADNIYRTTLTGAVSTTALSFPFASVTGLELPQYLVIDPEVPASTEIVFFDGAINVLDVSTTVLANRNQEGSVGAVAHSAGAEVWASPVGQNIEDLHDRVSLHDHTGGLMGSAIAAAIGDLNMGGFAINNVGLVDGVDVSDHGTRHGVAGLDRAIHWQFIVDTALNIDIEISQTTIFEVNYVPPAEWTTYDLDVFGLMQADPLTGGGTGNLDLWLWIGGTSTSGWPHWMGTSPAGTPAVLAMAHASRTGISGTTAVRLAATKDPPTIAAEARSYIFLCLGRVRT